MIADGLRRTTRHQDALRLLFLLDVAGFDVTPAAPPNAVAVIHSQTRLQALDFWMRNPDYLANELLEDVERGVRGPEAIEIARQVVQSDEPLLRRYPMIRWLFGAYEPLDNALGLLRAAGLIQLVRDGNPASGHVREHHYYLLSAGRLALKQLLTEHEEFSWYRDRALLVADLAGTVGGAALKERQYRQAEYAETTHGSRIEPILSRVRKRLSEMTRGQRS